MNLNLTSVWAYDYDEGGNRISKRVALLPISGADTSCTPIRKYVYDGVNMVADSGQLDSNWNQYAFLGYKRLAWVSQDSGVRVRYIVSDHLGTANLLMDNAGGILPRYVLDPWGNVEYAKETVPLRYLYTGKESDAEAGRMVTYINARYLDNERGMWLGRDPEEEFYTPYGYVGNGPLVGMDQNCRELYSIGDKPYRQKVNVAISQIIEKGGRPAAVIRELMSSKEKYYIQMPGSKEGNKFTGGGINIIKWSPDILISGKNAAGNYSRPAVVGLVHESLHAATSDRLSKIKGLDRLAPGDVTAIHIEVMAKLAGGAALNIGDVPNIEENYAIYLENIFRTYIGVSIRIRYTEPPSANMNGKVGAK